MSNSTDKRSVSTDALETLGTIIGEGAGRDAIHLAVEPAIAAGVLRPGQDVGFIGSRVGVCASPVGIVDPFLKRRVQPGERFWLIVYPRQITSLRHVWTHPSFPETAPLVEPRVAESEAWLRNFCGSNDCPCYETVMEVLASEHGVQLGDPEYYGVTSLSDVQIGYGDGRSYIVFKGIDAHCNLPDEFWDHAEIVLGKKFPNRVSYFSCTC
jgi:hypothetical protein